MMIREPLAPAKVYLIRFPSLEEDQMENASKNLAEEYRRLGGRRIAVIDDNFGSSRDWEGDPPEAAKFWEEQIASLSDREKRDVQSFLPSINDERDEPGSK
jgi:hypothetical protein